MSLRLIILLALSLWLPPAFSAGRDATSDARRDANRFIVEKLQRRDGEAWQRNGQYFLWSYSFSRDGCELRVRREDLRGGRVFEQSLPMADLSANWSGESALQLYCDEIGDCIDYRIDDQGERSEGRSSETSLQPPRGEDLPKLRDAFVELHRLCDDAYFADPQR